MSYNVIQKGEIISWISDMKNEYERLICRMDIESTKKKVFWDEDEQNKPQMAENKDTSSKKEMLKQLIYHLAEDDPSLAAIDEFAKVIAQNRIKEKPPSR